jgi:hypothetical protein
MPGERVTEVRKIAKAGVDVELPHVAIRNRVAFGAADVAALRAVLDAGSG